jgi:hypothetical protein
LRLLDYGQRLASHKRNIFSDDETGNSGIYAINQITTAGRKAMNNFRSNFFEVGAPFNAQIISARHPLISTSSSENLLNTLIYSSDETMQLGTISNGIWNVQNGQHVEFESIVDKFAGVMRALAIR